MKHKTSQTDEAVVDHTMSVPQGCFTLQRLPYRRRELLRAWDAADEYLLNYFAEHVSAAEENRVLIINDTFGALATALHSCQPQCLSDSVLSQQATQINLKSNGLNPEAAVLLNSLDAPGGKFDWVLIKVPKTMALLEYQLLQLRPHLTPDSRIVVAGMVKNLPSSVWQLLEQCVGPTESSRAWKKARMVFARLDSDLQPPKNRFPVCYTLEGHDYQICNHANVFSRESLDIGTRFFLQHLPEGPDCNEIIDLGCGNGVVGLLAAEKNPQATIYFVDESFMAVASARDNFVRAFPQQQRAQFLAANGLEGFGNNSADLVLCNPPFHQHHSVGDHIALAMFRDAKRVLRTGGELWVIGNRHLGYHLRLKQLFGNVATVAANPKFVILKAVSN